LLVARRRWTAVVWTLTWATLLLALSIAVFGRAPFAAFWGYQLPRIADGSAFPFLETFPPAIAVNHSIFGIILKLRYLHAPGMTIGCAGWVAWAYTAAIVAFAPACGRRSRKDRLGEALLWLLLLQLGTLRSPIAPDLYGLFIPAWMLSLLAVRGSRRVRIV